MLQCYGEYTHGGYFDTVRFVAVFSSASRPCHRLHASCCSQCGAPSSPVITKTLMQGNNGTMDFQAGTVVSLPYLFTLSEGNCISAAFVLHLAATCDGFVVLDFGLSNATASSDSSEAEFVFLVANCIPVNEESHALGSNQWDFRYTFHCYRNSDSS